MKQHNYYVYIITNPHKTVLYTGMTNNLRTRLHQHYQNRGQKSSFAGRYFCYNLLYYETYRYVWHAIDREKEIKHITRKQKEELINEINPQWGFISIND